MTYKTFLTIVFISSITLIQGCASLVIGGAAGVSAVHDRRTIGSFIEDENIELKAMTAYYSNENLHENTHINITSYNGIVLISGEAPTYDLKMEVDRMIRNIRKVRKVHNELIIAAPSSFLARSNDALLTTKAKIALTKIDYNDTIDLTQVKIVTENGTVFLMGMLSRKEAETVTKVIKHVGGVQRIVRLFEYSD